MYSILLVGTDPSLTMVRSQLLISRGCSVVNVSHIPYAGPIFHSARFDAVVLCYKLTESLSKPQLASMVARFGDSPVLLFTKEVSADGENLVQIWRSGRLKNDAKIKQVVSDLQALFRIPTTVPGSLQSWKEISAYMRRGIRTVQRWEKSFGLPVHRPSRSDRSAVFALISELDEWMRDSRAQQKFIPKENLDRDSVRRKDHRKVA